MLIIKGLLWIFLRICLASILIKPKPQVWNLWLISGHFFNVKLRWFLPRSSQCLAHYLRVLSHQGARTDLSTLDPKVQFVWLVWTQVFRLVHVGTVLEYTQTVLEYGLLQVWKQLYQSMAVDCCDCVLETSVCFLFFFLCWWTASSLTAYRSVLECEEALPRWNWPAGERQRGGQSYSSTVPKNRT